MRKRTLLLTGILCCVYSFAAAFVLETSVAQTPQNASAQEDVVSSSQGSTTRALRSLIKPPSRRSTHSHHNLEEHIPTRNHLAGEFEKPSAIEGKPEFLAAIDQPGIKYHHKQIANEVLMSLPELCRNTLKDFYVRYEKPKNRGLAGKSVMILDGTVPDEEFRALFIHESGHNFDLGCFTGSKFSGESAFADGSIPIYNDDKSIEFYRISWLTSTVQKSNSEKEDFVSGYASYDAFEDFAESFAYYILQYDTFKERANTNLALAQKLAWLEKYIGRDLGVATGRAGWDGIVPWDVTKLPYEWHSDLIVSR